MKKTVTQKAKEIIAKINYITIATVSSKGMPWNSPVYAAFDENYTFYWASWTENQHSKNIKENNDVFIVIYDSTAPEGGGGVYIKAKAYELKEKKEIERALLYYPWRNKVTEKEAKDFMSRNPFLGDYPRRLYKAIPEKVWMNEDGDIDGNFIDKRIEIELRK